MSRPWWSPLEHMRPRLDASSRSATSLCEVPFQSHTTLRGDLSDDEFRSATRDVLGFELPGAPNTTTSASDCIALRLGPDEWLLVGPKENGNSLRQRLRLALAGQHVAVVDISAARVVLQLAGPEARQVLERGCALDLHPRAFPPGRCTRTAVGPVEAILLHREDVPAWWLFVHNSYAEWFAEWLLDGIC